MTYLQNKPLTLCGPSTEHWDPTLWAVYWRLQLLPLTLMCGLVFIEGSNGYNPLGLLCVDCLLMIAVAPSIYHAWILRQIAIIMLPLLVMGHELST